MEPGKDGTKWLAIQFQDQQVNNSTPTDDDQEGAAAKCFLGFSDFGLQVTLWFVLCFSGSKYVIFVCNNVLQSPFLLIVCG